MRQNRLHFQTPPPHLCLFGRKDIGVFDLVSGDKLPGIPQGNAVFIHYHICLLYTSTYTKESMISKGKNSPYLGMEMQGKAVYTIVDGKILLDGGKVAEHD